MTKQVTDDLDKLNAGIKVQQVIVDGMQAALDNIYNSQRDLLAIGFEKRKLEFMETAKKALLEVEAAVASPGSQPAPATNTGPCGHIRSHAP